MFNRQVLFLLLAFLLILTGCSGSKDGEQSTKEDPGNDSSTLVPLADHLVDALCSMTRGSSEYQLIEAFGQPTERKATGDVVVLRWKNVDWSADAMFSNGRLKIASALAKQPLQAKGGNLLKAHPTWVAGQTRLEDMEAVLGPGVRVGVQWHPGIDVANSIRNRPDFDPAITRDRCSDRYSWTNLDMSGYSSLRFSNGVLQGAF